MSDRRMRATGRGHLVAIVVVGVVAVAATAAVAGWMTGYLKPHEKIALITWNDDPYWDQVIRGAQDAAKTQNADLIVVRSQPDEKAQTQHLQDVLGQGVKGIAISPNNPAGQEAVLDDAASKVALVTLDSDAPVTKRKAFVGTDNYAAGLICAEQVRDAIPDGGEVIVSVGNIGMNNARDRRQGLIDNLLDRRPQPDRKADAIDADLKGAHYTLDATVLDGGDPTKATAGVVDSLKAHPNAKCIVGLFSYSAPAIVKALAQTGQTGKIKIIGFDESDDTQNGVANGTIYSSILQDQYRCGFEAVTMIMNSVRNVDLQAPNGVRFVPLRIWVMRAGNLADLRADRMIHTPAGSKGA